MFCFFPFVYQVLEQEVLYHSLQVNSEGFIFQDYHEVLDFSIYEF